MARKLNKKDYRSYSTSDLGRLTERFEDEEGMTTTTEAEQGSRLLRPEHDSSDIADLPQDTSPKVVPLSSSKRNLPPVARVSSAEAVISPGKAVAAAEVLPEKSQTSLYRKATSFHEGEEMAALPLELDAAVQKRLSRVDSHITEIKFDQQRYIAMMNKRRQWQSARSERWSSLEASPVGRANYVLKRPRSASMCDDPTGLPSDKSSESSPAAQHRKSLDKKALKSALLAQHSANLLGGPRAWAASFSGKSGRPASSAGRSSRNASSRRMSLDSVMSGIDSAKADNGLRTSKMRRASHMAGRFSIELTRSIFRSEVRQTEEIDVNLPIKTYLSIAIGVGTGLCVQFVSLLSTQALFNPKMHLTKTVLDQNNLWGAFLVHASASIALALVAASIVLFYCPDAGGSGIPEVRTYLSGALYREKMDKPKTLIAKILSLSFLVASGIPGARDAIHMASILASNVCQWWASRERRLKRKKLIFISDAPRFMFISAGVAAGIGSSFRCPIAGILYALEEFNVHWSIETVGRCAIAAATASLVSWYLTGAIDGQSNFEDTTGTFDYSVIRITPSGHASAMSPLFRVWEMSAIVLLGILGGLLGALMVVLNGYGLARWRKKHMGGPMVKQKKLCEAAAVACVGSLIAVLLPALWPCRALSPIEQDAVDNGRYVQWHSSTCADGDVNEMAALTFSLQGTTMNNLFSASDDMVFSISTLLAYGTVYLFFTVIAIGTATPVGAFIPMVLVGASFGRALGTAVQTFGYPDIDLRFYAIMGGAGAFTGLMRTPMSNVALFVEISSNTLVSGPLILCCVTAKVVANMLTPSHTDFMCMWNDYPLLKEDPPDEFRHYTASHIMTELYKGVRLEPIVIGLKDNKTVGREILRNTKHSTFPVVVDRSSDHTLKGILRRADLEQLCANEALEEFFPLPIEQVMELYPWVVDETFPAARVYRWFMRMSLRQLLVVKHGTFKVVGVITRHDLHECCMQWPTRKRKSVPTFEKSQEMQRL